MCGTGKIFLPYVHFISKMKGAERSLRLETVTLCIMGLLQVWNVLQITGVEILKKRARFVLCLAPTEACFCRICTEEAYLFEAAWNNRGLALQVESEFIKFFFFF